MKIKVKVEEFARIKQYFMRAIFMKITGINIYLMLALDKTSLAVYCYSYYLN